MIKWSKHSYKYVLTSLVLFALTGLLYVFSEGNTVSLICVHVAIWLFAHATFISESLEYKHFLGLEVLFSVFMYIVFFSAKLDVLVMPVIGFALLASLLYNALVSTFMSIALVLFSVVMYELSSFVIIAYLVVSTFAPITVSLVKQRMNLIVAGLLSGAIMYFIVISQDFAHLEWRQCYALLNGLISPVLALGIMPIMESVFSVLTPMRLMEIANTTKPLLKRLMIEAPGTFHHSLYVGHLAETAASDIGADYLLARAGAYYHDIGKLYQPSHFFENLAGRPNPHDEMMPIESAECLRNHVKIGVEMLRKQRFPKAVIDIVQRHHGDSVMQYFYHKELESNPSAELANFRYFGPKPNTKEASIIMLADCVEAAVRANPSTPIDIMIDRVFEQKISEGQLADSELSFRDLGMIRKSFIHVLTASGHERVKYPGDKEE